MKKFCATPVVAIILKVSAVLALIIFLGSLITDITQISESVKQMANALQKIDNPMRIQIAMKLLTDLLLMLGLPSLLWMIADGTLLLRSMYLGDDCCEDDEDGCCCGHDHSEVSAAVEAPATEKSAE